ncbi:MAG: FHA domain-containing protein [Bacteroidia bacterium]|nr:FHA domain-containing protein [Bacteroidia bacterium]MCX7763887.1 FHA domain-containing protein [Bacteroidia bacterium]MDW8056790.1 FHA domain-containing protein [Bacteroidia bacterium]
MSSDFDPQRTQPLGPGFDPQRTQPYTPNTPGFDPQRTQPYNPTFDPQRTQPLPPGADFGRPQPFVPPPGGQSFDPKRTQVIGGGAAPGKEATFDPTRTQIYQGPGVSPLLRQAPQNRKIVGWLVSFTLHPNGVDFRLYEGRNTIGTDHRCDIVINDPAASGHHLTILYRAGEFLFRDELSTNGTFVNGEMQNEGKLRDGDVIKVGNTEFRFRTI